MKQLKAYIENHFALTCALLIGAAAIVYGVFALNGLVWADEAYSQALVRHSFPEIWKITASDSHPPLYYFYLKAVAAPFGYNLYVSRFASAIPCLLMMGLGAYHISKLFSKRTAVLFLFVYLFYPFTMEYAVEMRMYSLAELFIFLCAVYAYRCWKWNKTGDWILFALFGTCAAYCHYFSVVAAAMIYAALLFFAVFQKRELLKKWLIFSGCTILAYLPWLGCFISQLMYKVDNVYWIDPITVQTVLDYFKSLFRANGVPYFYWVHGGAYVIALICVFRSKDSHEIGLSVCALLVPLGTILVGIAVSFLLRPVFVIRYVVPAMPLMVFFFANALSKMPSRKLAAVLLAVVFVGGGVNMAYLAKHAVIADEERLSAQDVQQLPEHDAVILDAGFSLHIGQELSYYDPVTPIYTDELLGPDNPYPNRCNVADFHNQEDQVILVLDCSAAVPDTYLSHYHAEPLYTVTVSGSQFDLWYLTAK